MAPPGARLLGREGRPLRNTGRLFNSMSFRSSSASFSLIATANYAGFQNAGTRRIPARPFFPQGRVAPEVGGRARRCRPRGAA
jgi:phage gpG-like protein